jgi:nucleoside 2-deoxyribosyltransferase
MNIYFACSITGGRQDETIYMKLVESMLKDGHEVPTALLAGPEVSTLESRAHPALEVYTRDTAWIEAADAMVAEFSTPSHGVGFEIAYALHRGIPVLALHDESRTVSKMILGNTMQGLSIRSYQDEQQALEQLNAYLATL